MGLHTTIVCMAQAFACDRCDDLHIGKAQYVMVYGERSLKRTSDNPLEGKRYKDLCADCYGELEEFMDHE